MSSLPNQQQYTPNNIPMGLPACEGRKSITVQIDFTIALQYTLDLTAIQSMTPKMIDSVQTLWVDNSNSTTPLTILMGVTLQRIIVPAGSQGYFPILQPNPPVLQFTAQSAVRITIQILNFFVPPFLMGSAFTFTPSGTLQTADTILDATVSGGRVQTQNTPPPISLTDVSNTITSGGVSQNAIPANAIRKRFLICNPSTATEVLNMMFGATGHVITLTPGMIWDESGSTIYSGDVYLSAATTGHAFTAYAG